MKLGGSRRWSGSIGLLLVMLVALSGVPGYILGNSVAVTIAEEGNEDNAKLLVYARMLARGLESIGLLGASAEEVARVLGISVDNAADMLRIANLTVSEIFALGPEEASILKERAEAYYELVVSHVEKTVDPEEVKRSVDRALLERISDIVAKIGESVNDTQIKTLAGQIRNATSLEQARQALAQAVERLKALNIYMLSETLDSALLKSLEKLADKAELGDLENAIEKMREEIEEARKIVQKYQEGLDEVDPDVEGRLSLALERIATAETTVESMGTVAGTIVNKTGEQFVGPIDVDRVVEAGVKARISLLLEKISQVEAQAKSLVNAGVVDTGWVEHVLNLTAKAREMLANATAMLGQGNITQALGLVADVDSTVARVMFEVQYKSLEAQAIARAKIAAASSILAQVEQGIAEVSGLIERLYEVANTTGANATLGILMQARMHLSNAVQLMGQAWNLTNSSDPGALDVANQALRELMQAKALANAAKVTLTTELQAIASVPAVGNHTQEGGPAATQSNQTGNATLPDTQAPGTANRTTESIQAKLVYAQELAAKAAQLGEESAQEYAERAVRILQIAANLTASGEVEAAKKLVAEAELLMLKAEKEMGRHETGITPPSYDERVWRVKKEILEVELKVREIEAMYKAMGITSDTIETLLAEAVQLINESRARMDAGDIPGALDAAYKADDLLSQVEDMLEGLKEHMGEEREHSAEKWEKLAEAEKAIAEAQAVVERIRAYAPVENNTQARELIQLALQYINESHKIVEEARQNAEQGQDVTALLEKAYLLADQAKELAEKAKEIAERLAGQAREHEEKARDERGEAKERLAEHFDKLQDLSDKASELRIRISEARATGIYSEQVLDEAESLVSEAEELIGKAREALRSGENPVDEIRRAESLLERAEKLLSRTEEHSSGEDYSGQSKTEETGEGHAAGPSGHLAEKLVEQEARANAIEAKVSEAMATGLIDATVAENVKELVSNALALLAQARNTTQASTAEALVKEAEKLLDEAEYMLSMGMGTTGGEQGWSGEEKEYKKEEEAGQGAEGFEEYTGKIQELEKKALDIEAKARQAGLQGDAADKIFSLIAMARSSLEEARQYIGAGMSPEEPLKRAEEYLSRAESMLEEGYVSQQVGEEEAPKDKKEESEQGQSRAEAPVESSIDQGVTTSPENETSVAIIGEEESDNTTTSTANPEEEKKLGDEVNAGAPEDAQQAADVEKLLERIKDTRDKASDLREKANEVQDKAAEENSPQAVALASEALSLIAEAETLLSKASNLASAGDYTGAEELVSEAQAKLEKAESLIDQAEDLVG